MEPEIARRCSACGASIRGGAFSCPQCGRPAKAEATDGVVAAETPEIPGLRKTDAVQNSPLLATQSGQVEPVSAIALEAAEQQGPPTEAVAVASEEETEARSKRGRIVSATREAVGEKISPRVQKLRQASNVVLEEASYDPSVRFVLIAIVIFLLSLLLFFLNRVLG